jgi:regulator of sirC expression with transglutaminase-like and TPR domain
MTNPEIQALISLLADEDTEVLRHVTAKLRELGEEGIPYLEQEWQTATDTKLQSRILNLIHEMQFELLQERLHTWKQLHQDDLLMVLWMINTYMYPNLEYNSLRQQIDVIYLEASRNFEENVHPYEIVKQLNYSIFEKLRFGPNKADFHSENNSMFNKVLENKKGNPIALCSLYLLISERMKLPIYGVNFPNLFLLTYKRGEQQFYINAFNRGLILSRSDISNYLNTLKIQVNELFFQPCNNLDIALRVLRNLLSSFEAQSKTQQMEEVGILMHILSGNTEDDFNDDTNDNTEEGN